MSGRLSWRHRMRLWWARTFTVGVPRPQPILLRELYPEPMRRIHVQLQDWEDEGLIQLLDTAAPSQLAAIHDDAARLLRSCRIYLLLLQRLRHQRERGELRWQPDGVDAVSALETTLEPLFSADDLTPALLTTLRAELEARVETLR